MKPYTIEPGTGKRLLDVVLSAGALILLSPVLLLIAIAIRVESHGPILYGSLRVGAGYRTFTLWKFRTMYLDAESRLKDMKHLNMYGGKKESTWQDCPECTAKGKPCSPIYLFDKWGYMCERRVRIMRRGKAASAFVKISNDPRITKIGAFLRNTSLDEIPQLFNVLFGDMSIVGNRPLPLYEAEQLTTTGAATRFLAPAGITGLWQVTKRGSAKVSARERIQLDNIYAQTRSFWGDVLLMGKTVPALLQKENV
jgi:lipopolysaccharide/colanic/teichoic acid biosynthesis glycosyltransferase